MDANNANAPTGPTSGTTEGTGNGFAPGCIHDLNNTMTILLPPTVNYQSFPIPNTNMSPFNFNLDDFIYQSIVQQQQQQMGPGPQGHQQFSVAPQTQNVEVNDNINSEDSGYNDTKDEEDKQTTGSVGKEKPTYHHHVGEEPASSSSAQNVQQVSTNDVQGNEEDVEDQKPFHGSPSSRQNAMLNKTYAIIPIDDEDEPDEAVPANGTSPRESEVSVPKEDKTEEGSVERKMEQERNSQPINVEIETQRLGQPITDIEVITISDDEGEEDQSFHDKAEVSTSPGTKMPNENASGFAIRIRSLDQLQSPARTPEKVDKEKSVSDKLQDEDTVKVNQNTSKKRKIPDTAAADGLSAEDLNNKRLLESQDGDIDLTCNSPINFDIIESAFTETATTSNNENNHEILESESELSYLTLEEFLNPPSVRMTQVYATTTGNNDFEEISSRKRPRKERHQPRMCPSLIATNRSEDYTIGERQNIQSEGPVASTNPISTTTDGSWTFHLQPFLPTTPLMINQDDHVPDAAFEIEVPPSAFDIPITVFEIPDSAFEVPGAAYEIEVPAATTCSPFQANSNDRENRIIQACSVHSMCEACGVVFKPLDTLTTPDLKCLHPNLKEMNQTDLRKLAMCETCGRLVKQGFIKHHKMINMCKTKVVRQSTKKSKSKT